MKFQTFWGGRLTNFAFKFDLRHFFEIVKVQALRFLPLKNVLSAFKIKIRSERGSTLLFSPLIYTKTCNHPPARIRAL